MRTELIATAEVSEWQEMSSAPWGYKCLLLTVGGVAVIGTPIDSQPGYIGWAPMPRIPPRIKELISKGVAWYTSSYS